MSTKKENFAEMVLLLCGMLGYRRTYINIYMYSCILYIVQYMLVDLDNLFTVTLL